MDEPPKNTIGNHFWSRFSTSSLVRFLLLFASGWALLETFRYFEYVIATFTLAAVLAVLLNYPVRYLERFLGRGIALSVVIVLSLMTLIVLLVIGGITISAQIQQLVNQIIQVFSSTTNPLEQFQRFLLARNIPLNLEPVEAQLRELLTSSATFVVSSLPSVLNSYLTFIITLVIAFFMLSDGERIWRFLLRLIPNPQRYRFATAIQHNFQGFFRGQLLISLVLSVATFIVFVLFQIPFALALAITVGVFDLIPGIGATLGITLVTLIVLVQGGWLTALKVLAACIVLQQLQDNFLSPRVMQSTVNLNPVVLFFALLVGGRVAGVLGIFLAVPIAGVVVSLLEIEELRASHD
ncbi:MAG: AI-2E family transporter [Leptolyngbyaceae bacterium]|nr:AI-2E family transporter [Leptolyngbyaceae bacterium]